MCCACRCLYRHVEVQSDLCLLLPLCNGLISGVVGSNEKVAPNKVAYSADWGTGKVWASLSIDSLWIVGICRGQIFKCPHLQLGWFRQTRLLPLCGSCT
jgi:hypothetical protein